MADPAEALAGRPVPRMTEAEYEAERGRLRSLYGDDGAQAGAKREQALALLFARSGWTQEELAKKEGKSQTWMVFALRFGRFLNITTGNNPTLPPNLTERRFREYWERTDKADGNERERFGKVVDLLRQGPRPPIRPAILASFADSEWHSVADIKTELGVDDDNYVIKAIENIHTHPEQTNAKVERRKYGKSFQFRIFPEATTKVVSVHEIRTKLGPHIKRLIAQGKCNIATISIPSVAECAFLIDQQIAEWDKRPPSAVGAHAARSSHSPKGIKSHV